MIENIRADEVVSGDRVQVGTNWQVVESVRHTRRRDDTVYVQVDWVGGGGAVWPDDIMVTVHRQETIKSQPPDTDDPDPKHAFAVGDPVVVIDSSSPYYNQAGTVAQIDSGAGPGAKWTWYVVRNLIGPPDTSPFRYFQLSKTSRK